MRVLIVVGANIRYCPYADFYINILTNDQIPFDVIYPDKKNLDDVYEYSTISYKWNNNSNKLLEYNNYRKFVIKVIDKNQYNCVIILTTPLAVMFGTALKKRNIKYIVDIRDYTHENLRIYYYLERKAVKNSICTVISSPDFRKFLPLYNYLDIYNFPQSISNDDVEFMRRKDGKPIIISYIGTIAYPDQCEALMRLVENDTRFEFDLYGNDLNGSRVSEYITNNNFKRSRYFGPYKPEDKEKIIKKSDILFNAYGNNSPLLLYALSNKLTDATIYKKPVLNSPNTSMDKCLGGCSFAIDFNKTTSLDELYDWYNKLDSKIVQTTFKNLYKKIVSTNNSTRKKIRAYIQKCN